MYNNLASADHPATLIYLVDISGSMNARMPDGKSRLEVARDAIQIAYTQMIQRSLRQGKIYPRYRVGMIAYSNDLYDVYGNMGSIIPIDKLKDEGIPSLTPQKGTDMSKAFRYAYKLIQDDLKTWSQEWLNSCPSPMVINITDCEYDEGIEDPLEYAQKLQMISIPDGNVLVQNIFITDQISLPVHDIKEWSGYRFSETTGDPYGDKYLAMSSAIPENYARIMREQAGLKIKEGSAMMFPGINREFIKTGMVMSVATGAQINLFRNKVVDLDRKEVRTPFEPMPRMQIDLGGELIEFTQLEAYGSASAFVYAETGKEGNVYKVMKGSLPFALKVFYPEFQDHRVIENTEKLLKLRNLPGLAAADRTVISYKTHPKLVNKYPELNYAILMPWIQGTLWQTLMNNEHPLNSGKYIHIASSLASLLCDLESLGLAHCDLSSDNIIISPDLSSIELIDIENMYAADMPRPVPDISFGTVGYRNRWIAENGLWGAESDRFASAILLAEIVTWGFKEIRENRAGDTSFFDEYEVGEQSERYHLMKDCLGRLNPELAILFEQVWSCNTPAECPHICEWKIALEKLRRELYEGRDIKIQSKTETISLATPRFLQVFLCHSSADKPKARRLYRRLTNEGWIDPWLDEAKIKPGQDWDFEIKRALQKSDVVIVCLSIQSITKEGYVQKEIKMALDKANEKPEGEVYIIPLRWDDCNVPDSLIKWHWVDVKNKDWYKNLKESLRIRASKFGIDSY